MINSNEDTNIEKKYNWPHLTTEDNPYNPFTQFDDWYAFDEQMGYHSCSYLDRIISTSDELSIPDQLVALEEAIDEIVKFNLTGNYKKVYESDYKN